MFDILGPLEGRTILDLGCGYNPTPVYFALAGAKKVIACDVSPRAVDFVSQLANNFGVADRITPFCGPAAELPFADESIDLLHGEAVLHHLDLDASGAQLARVLKKGGRAAFKDPLGHNFLLEFARDYLPYGWKHAIKGTDCPLRFSEIKRFGRHFSYCDARGFGLFSMFAIILCGRGRSRLQTLAHRVDDPILRCVPWLQRACRFVVTRVEK
jgi:SAM-dependent methyltransferase